MQTVNFISNLAMPLMILIIVIFIVFLIFECNYLKSIQEGILGVFNSL